MTAAGSPPNHAGSPPSHAVLPPSLAANPDLDTWVRVDGASTVTVFTGKVELGQGIVSAIARVAAEELDLGIEQVRVQTADTANGLNEGHTAGSMSVEFSGAAIRQATAEARAHLVELASRRLGVPVDALEVHDGTVHDPSREHRVTYWDLLGGRRFDRRAAGDATPKSPRLHRLVGRPETRRVDLRGLVTGETRFVQDLRHERMTYGRVVRPPSPGARLEHLDETAARAVPGVLAVVIDGGFVGVVAERESQASKAADALRRGARWSEFAAMPPNSTPASWLREQPDQAFLVVDGTPVAGGVDGATAAEAAAAGAATAEPAAAESADARAADGVPGAPPAWSHAASYSRPYLMHASIGPSAAMTLWEHDQLTVWSCSQGVFALRAALAATLRLPAERIRVRHVIGSGCYGHNGADDVALDSALLAMAVPGRPVLLQWSRADEHQWEPFGAPSLVEIRASVDGDGRIVDWRHDVWGTTHTGRPMNSGGPNLLAGAYLDPPVPRTPPRPALGKEVGIHRNATPIYDLPRQRIVKHFVATATPRTSSLRSLGAHANVFAIESFMDELAARERISPVEFRLRHLGDERARAVLRAAVDASAWSGDRSKTSGAGTGVGLARYKNRAGYAVVVVRAHIEDATSRIAVDHITIAADCGEIIDPRGLENQLEGGALQSLSWTLGERVTFDDSRVTSTDWDTYPILRFPHVPTVETVLLDRPGQPYLGAGEITQGPTAAAIANAVFDAVGLRLRDMPLTPAAVQRAAEASESAWASVR